MPRMSDREGWDPVWDSARRQLGDGCLSVLMPAHNLGDAIANNVRRVHELLNGQIPFEIVVVDDGSEDDTGPEVRRCTEILPEVKAVHLATNMGKGAALREAFKEATGTHIFLLDGDLDLPPRQMSVFFDIMAAENADVVIGSKRHPDSTLDYPLRRRLISFVYYTMVKILTGLPVHDTQTGMKLFKRDAIDWAFSRMLVKRYAFDLEVLALVHLHGCKIAESPVIIEFKGKWGAVSRKNIRNVLHETLAIFYRLRIKHYYQNLPE